jgi:hypothetical protein
VAFSSSNLWVSSLSFLHRVSSSVIFRLDSPHALPAA